MEQLRAPANLLRPFAALSLASIGEHSRITPDRSDYSSSTSGIPSATDNVTANSISSRDPVSTTNSVTGSSISSQYPALIAKSVTDRSTSGQYPASTIGSAAGTSISIQDPVSTTNRVVGSNISTQYPASIAESVTDRSTSGQYPASTTGSVTRSSIFSRHPASTTDSVTGSSIFSHYPVSVTGIVIDFDKVNTEAPFADVRSNCSSTSSKTAADDYGSDYAASNFSDSDGEGVEVDQVIHMLDCHLVSVLDGDHDLAAYLIPKIHDRMKQDEDLVHRWVSGLDSDNTLNFEDSQYTIERQTTSFRILSTDHQQRKITFGRSSQRHGRGSGESQGQDESGDRKRRKRGTDANSGDAPERNADHGIQRSEPERQDWEGPTGNPDRNPDDPGEDPGDARHLLGL
jgi:hypothetical protein